MTHQFTLSFTWCGRDAVLRDIRDRSQHPRGYYGVFHGETALTISRQSQARLMVFNACSVIACLTRITRHPKPWTAKNFGPVEWLPDYDLDDDPLLSELLPQGVREMSAKDLATIEKWFGARGKFPSMKIATGELGFLTASEEIAMPRIDLKVPFAGSE